MRIRPSSVVLTLAISFAVLGGGVPNAAFAATPLVGGAAPEFQFVGEGDATYQSADFFSPTTPGAGRGVVIAWFPKAFTSG